MDLNKIPEKKIRRDLTALFPRLWRYCLALSGSGHRADDVAQATCLRVLEKAHQFQPGTHFDRWVFRIAQRLWLNELRSDAVRRGGGMAPIDEIELVDEKPGAETNLLARQVLLKVMALPEAQRVAVLLVYVEGYSYKEASEILDVPIGTIMSRLAAARSKMAAHFDTRQSNAG